MLIITGVYLYKVTDEIIVSATVALGRLDPAIEMPPSAPIVPEKLSRPLGLNATLLPSTEYEPSNSASPTPC